MKYDKVLVPLDGSQNAESAIGYAKSFAENYGSKILLFTCIDTRSYRGLFQSYVEPSEVLQRRFEDKSADYRETLHEILKKEEDLVEGYMRELRDELAREGVDVEVVICRGEPSKRIAGMAEELGADMILMASQGLTGKKGRLLGSVARKVLEDATIPVFVVK